MHHQSSIQLMLPGTKSGSEITKNSVQQSSEIQPPPPPPQYTNTNNEVANTLPIKNTKSTGTYKILPLYSESSEKVANSASSVNAYKKEVTST